MAHINSEQKCLHSMKHTKDFGIRNSDAATALVGIEGFIQKRRQRSSLLIGAHSYFHSFFTRKI